MSLHREMCPKWSLGHFSVRGSIELHHLHTTGVCGVGQRSLSRLLLKCTDQHFLSCFQGRTLLCVISCHSVLSAISSIHRHVWHPSQVLGRRQQSTEGSQEEEEEIACNMTVTWGLLVLVRTLTCENPI